MTITYAAGYCLGDIFGIRELHERFQVQHSPIVRQSSSCEANKTAERAACITHIRPFMWLDLRALSAMCSYAPNQGEGGLTMAGSSLDLGRIQKQGGQDLAPSTVKVRLYTG